MAGYCVCSRGCPTGRYCEHGQDRVEHARKAVVPQLQCAELQMCSMSQKAGQSSATSHGIG